MQFQIGPFAYVVVIAAEPIVDPDTGQNRCGLAVYDNRTLHLSASLSPDNRWDTLLHEIYEAWCFHVPRPTDHEQMCNLFAMASAAAQRDLAEQGGLDALAALEPGGDETAELVVTDDPAGTEAGQFRRAMFPDAADADVVARDDTAGAHLAPLPDDFTYEPVHLRESAEAETYAHGGRASCLHCDTIVSSASIVTEPVRWDHARRGLVVDRALYCPCCHHVQRWTEGTLTSGGGYGVPNGDPIAPPTFETTAAAVNAFLMEHPEAEGLVA